MRMIGTLRRMVVETTPPQIHDRAVRGDHAWFAQLYAPMTALAAVENGLPVVLMTQRDPVRELDADHAVLVLLPGGLRVFGTEVGVDITSGQPNRFFVEFDPYAVGPGTRKG